jgi:hypothetical protein
MAKNPTEDHILDNTLHIEGVFYRTSGNIVFSDTEENPFYLAKSAVLDQLDGYLENGMHMLLKKAGQ